MGGWVGVDENKYCSSWDSTKEVGGGIEILLFSLPRDELHGRLAVVLLMVVMLLRSSCAEG